jgi:hypothetical protein
MTQQWTLLIALLLPLPALAADNIGAIQRNNGENYRDRALVSCIAEAYQGTPAGDDAAISMAAFIEWTYYDDDNGDPMVDQLVAKYLRRDYRNPVEGYVGAKFDALKCVDMYHSAELDQLVKKYVPHPDWIGDKPAR